MRTFAVLLIALAGIACVHTLARPTAYGVELQACSAGSATLAQSHACEDEVRARYGRPLLDGGSNGDR